MTADSARRGPRRAIERTAVDLERNRLAGPASGPRCGRLAHGALQVVRGGLLHVFTTPCRMSTTSGRRWSRKGGRTAFPTIDVLREAGEPKERPRSGADSSGGGSYRTAPDQLRDGFPLLRALVRRRLWHGRPLVAAVWCFTSHALRAGVSTTRGAGGPLQFEFRRPSRRAAIRAVPPGGSWGWTPAGQADFHGT